MEPMDFEYIFRDAFETFKVFECIPFEKSGVQADSNSKTIWQILNHLVQWQEYQIANLNDSKNKITFDEFNSWIEELEPLDQKNWNEKVSEFNHQIGMVKQFISQFNSNGNEYLKIIQDLSTHLSFHLGEIIFLGRFYKIYPQAYEMNDFLAQK